jgi:alpha-tubulin suppressor-like RCC1 family protein
LELPDHRTPVRLAGISNVKAVAGSPTHRLALRSDGTVWAWGNNLSGQLGNGTTISSAIPVQVQDLSDVVAIAAPGEGWYLPSQQSMVRHGQRPERATNANGVGGYSLALKSDGTVWGWGANMFDGSHVMASQHIHGLPDVTAIAAGTSHALALGGDGSVWQWGRDTGGLILGVPARVAGLADVTAISADWNEYLAVRRDGTVWEWIAFSRRGPAPIPRVTNITVAVLAHPGPRSLALARDGTLWEWTCLTCSPQRIRHLSHIIAIAGGSGHSLALRADGTVWQWQWYPSESQPRRVARLTGVTAISAAGSSNLAVTGGGT